MMSINDSENYASVLTYFFVIITISLRAFWQFAMPGNCQSKVERGCTRYPGPTKLV